MKSYVNKMLTVFMCGCCVLFLPFGRASDPLYFHEFRGSNVYVYPNQTTAIRMNRSNCCYAGVVTSRVLKPDELFEVRIDALVSGRSSINIGATTASAKTLNETEGFPQFMYQMRPWNCIIWSNFVVSNDTTINDNYGPDLLDLKVGDKVGVKKMSSDLHMYVNGQDQGAACTDVPTELYGLVDIIDKTIQVSITGGESERSAPPNPVSKGGEENSGVKTPPRRTTGSRWNPYNLFG